MADPLKTLAYKESLLDITARWRIRDLFWPWKLPPPSIRILIYADFQGAFNGSSFDGLKHVLATLAASPYYWVSFEVGRANRGADASADATLTNKRLDQINLADWDQVWFFGLGGGTGDLSTAEVAAIRTFMDGGGGVLMTGDHEDLGAAIGKQVPRAGKMRGWTPGVDAPSSGGLDRHSTLREGTTPGFVFEDQSDDVPQTIVPIRQTFLSGGRHVLKITSFIHPVLCGPAGPITVLPDHMHEGEVLAPTILPTDEWPEVNGHQEAPKIIANASIVQPDLNDSGMQFGVLGAYDGHRVDVGRIVVDATWHHWFDINLIGENGATVGANAGFISTDAGRIVLKQIETYFLNVAIWLARESKQTAMRNAMLWGAIWKDPLVMGNPKTDLQTMGKFALDALGKFAPKCMVVDWIYLPILKRPDIFKIPPWPERFPIEEFVLGSVIKTLTEHMHKLGKIPTKVDAKEVARLMDSAFTNAPKEAAAFVVSELESDLKTMQSFLRTQK